MSRQAALRALLWLIALYHILFGAAAFLSASMAERLASSVFGIRLVMEPAMAYVVKVLGTYAITFGVMAAVAARDPVRHRPLLHVIVLLYALRVVTKLVFKAQYAAGLQVADGRIWTEAALLLGFALGVFLLRPRPSAGSAA